MSGKRENVHQVGSLYVLTFCSCHDFSLFKGLLGFYSLGGERKISLGQSATRDLFAEKIICFQEKCQISIMEWKKISPPAAPASSNHMNENADYSQR